VADDIIVKNSAGEDVPMAADDIGGGRLAQIVKVFLGSDGQAYLLSGNAGAVDNGTLRIVHGTGDPVGDVAAAGGAVITTNMARPADTAPYAAGDSWADQTAGATLAKIVGAARSAGRSGVITDILLASTVSPGTLLQGELWIFDSAVTPLQDNAAWALADADISKLLAVVPFQMVTSGSVNNSSYCHLTNLNIGFTAVGSADLPVLVKVTNGYTPSSAEVLTMKTKVLRSN
jgi:hypothetical protein